MFGSVQLRPLLISPDAAEYVYRMRTDTAYNMHLSAVQGRTEDQCNWNKGYKALETDLCELHYVTERLDRVPCKLVRLYEITRKSFTWGSRMLDRNKPPKAALEWAMLRSGIVLRQLDIPKAQFEVQRDNDHAIAFYRRFGATQTHETELELIFEYTKPQAIVAQPGFIAILEGERQK